MHFGNLVRALRTTRGLTQTELAERSKVTLVTINRLELSEAPRGYKSTLLAIYHALDDSGIPLSQAEARDFCTAAGLSEQLWRLGTFHVAPAADDVIRAAGSLDEPSAQAVRRVIDLLRRHGASRVAPAIEALAASLDAQHAAAAPAGQPRTLRVVSPPRQRDGYVEQRIVEYEERPVPAKRATKPARRKGSA